MQLESGDAFRAMHERVSVRYVDEFVRALPDRGEHAGIERALRLDPEAELAGSDGGRSLSGGMLRLVVSLVEWLHATKPTEGTFMVFAPTYRHLEQLYNTMLDGSVGSLVAIDVLHSSVDIEDCLRTMSAVASSSNRSKRKLLLASAIADSSVTIPGVSVVIDLCRSLEVKWDRSSRNHVAKTVWASKSICDQRKGRTGRTCPGSVYRMVSKGFYINRLDMWDRPQLTVPSRLFRLLLRC